MEKKNIKVLTKIFNKSYKNLTVLYIFKNLDIIIKYMGVACRRR